MSALTPERLAEIAQWLIQFPSDPKDREVWHWENNLACRDLLAAYRELQEQLRLANAAASAEAILADEANVLAKSLRPQWSEERPTVAGWYWLKSNDHPPRVGEWCIESYGSFMVCGDDAADAFELGDYYTHFAGPLTAP